MRMPAEITFFASVGQKDINVSAARARKLLGLPRGDICIVGNVVVRSQLQREPCLSVPANPCELQAKSTEPMHLVFLVYLDLAATKQLGHGYTNKDALWLGRVVNSSMGRLRCSPQKDSVVFGCDGSRMYRVTALYRSSVMRSNLVPRFLPMAGVDTAV